jgi:hypothetical protein
MALTDDTARVQPGFNPSVRLDHFTPEERVVLERISKDWYGEL